MHGQPPLRDIKNAMEKKKLGGYCVISCVQYHLFYSLFHTILPSNLLKFTLNHHNLATYPHLQ